MKAAALRDEIAVKQELFKRLLTAVEEMKLQIAFPARVELIHSAELPKAK